MTRQKAERYKNRDRSLGSLTEGKVKDKDDKGCVSSRFRWRPGPIRQEWKKSIETLLGSRKGWFVCGEAADGLHAVEGAKSLRPDLIVMDVSMPNMNGLEARTIRQSYDDKQSKPVPTGLSKNRTFSAI